ncbi:MAG: ankyrin repeat domain-containing protein [Candidatus Omnitrophota bacterium]
MKLTQDEFINQLFLAADQDHEETVKDLLASNKDKDVDEKMKHGRTVLHAASESGHLEIVKLLVDAGADMNISANSGMTPLHLAAKYGYPEVVKFFIGAGAAVNVRSNSGTTPLHLAAQSGHPEVVNLLISAGADLGEKDERGFTALILASMNDRLEIVKPILESGDECAINAFDANGWTALMHARDKRCVEIAQLLEKRGAITQPQNRSQEKIILKNSEERSRKKTALSALERKATLIAAGSGVLAGVIGFLAGVYFFNGDLLTYIATAILLIAVTRFKMLKEQLVSGLTGAITVLILLNALKLTIK